MSNLNSKLPVFFLIITLFFSACDNGDEPQPEPDFKLPSKVINKIEIDANGVKWFATEKGIVSFDGTNWTIFSDNAQLINGAIFDIAAESQNSSANIWMGGKTGVSFFNKTENPVNITNYKKDNSDVLSDTIYSIGINNSNAKFMGTAKGLWPLLQMAVFMYRQKVAGFRVLFIPMLFRAQLRSTFRGPADWFLKMYSLLLW
jgi:ligand-binding sensor domain-containing protein